MGHGEKKGGIAGKDGVAGGPSVMSTTAPSSRGLEAGESSLSVLSGCSRSPSFGFGSALRFKWERQQKNDQERLRQEQTLSQSSSSPALLSSMLAATETSVQSPLASPSSPLSDVGHEEATRNENEILADEVEGAEDGKAALLMQSSQTPKPSGYHQYFGDCVARIDGSTDRFLAPREHAGEPRPESYSPAKTMGEGTSTRFHQMPMYSFGGGKSRMDFSDQKLAPSTMGGGLDSLKDRRSKRKKMSRGFGSAARLQVKGGPLELPISPGPAAYELTREGDKVPDWASKSRLPWGVRTGGRTTLQVPVASDVGPGEYTANHPFQAAGPAPKIGNAFKELPDSRKKLSWPFSLRSRHYDWKWLVVLCWARPTFPALQGNMQSWTCVQPHARRCGPQSSRCLLGHVRASTPLRWSGSRRPTGARYTHRSPGKQTRCRFAERREALSQNSRTGSSGHPGAR